MPDTQLPLFPDEELPPPYQKPADEQVGNAND